MGNRIAELKDPGYEGGTIGWTVYQSTAMANFTPIFHNQLAAELFALALRDIYPLWDDANQTILAAQVNRIVHQEFGDEPERHPLYEDSLDQENLDSLHEVLRNYRRAAAGNVVVKP